MSSGVYQPYVFVRREEKPQYTDIVVSDDDRRIFSLIDRLMGPSRRWSGIDGRLGSNEEGGGRPSGMGTGGMAPEELRVRRFMESCTFKAMISCAGGKSVRSSPFVLQHTRSAYRFRLGNRSGCIHGKYRSDVNDSNEYTRCDTLAERRLARNARSIDELCEELRGGRSRLQHSGM